MGSTTQTGRRTIPVLMVAGGTGGHIFPALAVAEELRRRSEDGCSNSPHYAIEFLGTRRALESKLIPGAGFPLRTLDAAGLKGIGGVRKLRNLLVLPRTAWQAAWALRELKPQVVVGVGGYLAGPVMLEAALFGIPTVLIEPNARPGFTNRVLAPWVRAAAVGFEATAHFYGKKAILTGLPLRQAFFEVAPKSHTPPCTVLIIGGSQGSRAINQAVMGSLPLLAAGAMEIRIVHQTGEADYNEVRKTYQDRGFPAEIHAFVEDMPGALERADLVISRAGAVAVTELAAAGRAGLLIPFPGATDQHQLENARVLEHAGAARVIVQSELTPKRLVQELMALLSAPQVLVQMEVQAHLLAKPGAAGRIADLVETLARKV